MKVIGIIAEYNPFHNGHRLQIQEIRRRFPDAGQIVLETRGLVVRIDLGDAERERILDFGTDLRPEVAEQARATDFNLRPVEVHELLESGRRQRDGEVLFRHGVGSEWADVRKSAISILVPGTKIQRFLCVAACRIPSPPSAPPPSESCPPP